ncbi:MAG: hypothetical protein AAF657_00845 [Acidobacteriota bacterium]
MERRDFLIGMLALAGGSATRPLFAHPGRFQAVESGATLLLMTSMASRGSRAFARGLPVDLATSSGRMARFWSVEGAVERFGERLGRADRLQLERNLSFFADHFAEIFDWDDARHFCSYWNHEVALNLVEARGHLESCGACRRARRILVQGTDLGLIPFMVADEVTVIAGPQGADPKKPLRLPEIPRSMRSALAGKELRMKVCVDHRGVASVTRVDSPNISDFVVRRAVNEVESTPWVAAANRIGRPTEDTVSVVFRWQS